MRPTATDAVIRTTLRGAWPSLPALTVASAALCAAATVPTLIAPGVNPIAVLLYALIAAPFLAALCAIANTAAFNDVATIREWTRAVRAYGTFAISQALIPAAAAELFLAAQALWSRSHPLWTLPSLALTGAATVLTLLGLLATLPLGIARPNLRGRLLWVTALHLVARRPSRFLAIFSLTALGLWAATTWTASLLLLLPAPAALVTAAAVWTTATEATAAPVSA
jgi:hypothetical protein